MIESNYTTVKVIFVSNANVTDEDLRGEKAYTYKCLKSCAIDLVPLDRVIITDPYGKLKLVSVVEVHKKSIIKKESEIDYKYITGTVKFCN